MKAVEGLKEIVERLYPVGPNYEDVIYVSFVKQGKQDLCAEKTLFQIVHEKVGESWGYGGAHRHSFGLLVVFVVEAEIILFENEIEESGGGNFGEREQVIMF